MLRRVALITGMALGTALGLSVPAGAQLVSLGTQFQVNTYTTNDQGLPSVGTDAAGHFVVVWQGGGSAETDTDGSVVQGRRYDAAGTPLGAEFQVNTYTTSIQSFPVVATRDDGSFVVVWPSYGSAGSDTSSGSIQGRRYDAAGAPLGSQFQINTYTTSNQGVASVAMDANGNFVVVWESIGSVGSDTASGSVQAQRYDAFGASLGPQFQVNTYTTSFQGGPAVAANQDGSFVVVWYSGGSAGSDTSLTSIQGQRYDAAASPVGGEFQVNTYTTSSQFYLSVAASEDGRFLVVWTSDGSAGSDTSAHSVQGRHYDAAGTPLGAQFQVNTYTTLNQLRPRAAMNPDGSFVIVWYSNGSPGTDSDFLSIQAQRYDATGSALGGQLQVNAYTTSQQADPAVAADAAGNLIVAWDSFGGLGSDQLSRSVQVQRLALGRPVLGKKMLVKAPPGGEDRRTVIVLGKETATDIGASVLGNPTATGAMLRVITNGTTPSDQTYVLDSSGWSTAGTVGYRYSGPTGGDGDPVKKVLVKRTPGGTALVKATLKGSVGTQSLDVVPPNAGDDGGIILTIPGGGTYCATFGGAAGGTEVQDDGELWKVTSATAQGCPTTP